ncbi:hypothetical protein [Calothrix sp. NIES-3974]|uniref:hypothetical protein n=1 Tax=Calothrix sp. NIES-3974 TaxID=2005462 RepID=UPI0012FDB8AF|nr:hypothetical protein [Calothrix sp. NIES-3974]
MLISFFEQSAQAHPHEFTIITDCAKFGEIIWGNLRIFSQKYCRDDPTGRLYDGLSTGRLYDGLSTGRLYDGLSTGRLYVLSCILYSVPRSTLTKWLFGKLIFIAIPKGMVTIFGNY